ncbi:hypothetical protein [Methylomonas sp. YC3]
MKKYSVVYYLDGAAALSDSKLHDSGLIMNYYDGPVIYDAPNNCINVKADCFVDYFLSNIDLLPIRVDFTNKDLSEVVKNQISGSIMNVIQHLEAEFLKVIHETELSAETVNFILRLTLTVLMRKLSDNQANGYSEIEKLINLMHGFLQNNMFLLDAKSKQVAANCLRCFEGEELRNDTKSLQIWYALSVIVNPLIIAELQDKYFNILADSDDLMDIYNNYGLICLVFPSQYLGVYISLYSKNLFRENFFVLSIEAQKKLICKLVYFTILFYERSVVFLDIYKAIYPIYLKAISSGLTELVLWLYPPLLYCHNGVLLSQDDFRRFNDEVDKPLEAYLRNEVIPTLNILPNPRRLGEDGAIRKVVFLLDRLVDYSIFNVLYSLLINLKKGDASSYYYFLIYDLNSSELGGSDSSLVKKITGLGFEYIDLHGEYVGSNEHFYSIFKKVTLVRERLVQDNVDILIAVNGRPEINFLFASRVAPIQIFWSHGNYVFDVQGIDKRILHYSTDDYKLYGYEFSEFNILTDYSVTDKHDCQQKANFIRQRWSGNTIVLGAIGRLAKMEDREYLNVIARLLLSGKDLVFLVCGNGDNSRILAVIESFGVSDKVFFEGYIDPKVYAFVIDIYLDPFPSGGGESLEEFRSRSENNFIVSIGGNQMNEGKEGADRYFMQALTYIEYIDYMRSSYKSVNVLRYNKFVICSDMPSNVIEVDFIVGLLREYANVLYAIPKNDKDFESLFLDKRVDEQILWVDVENIFEYSILSDLYLLFYNNALRDVFLIKNEIPFVNVCSYSQVDVCIRDLWAGCDENSVVAYVVADISGCDKSFFNTSDGRYKAFSLMYESLGLKKEQFDGLWGIPMKNIDMAKIICDFSLECGGYIELLKKSNSLYYKYNKELQLGFGKSVSRSFFELIDAWCYK